VLSVRRPVADCRSSRRGQWPDGLMASVLERHLREELSNATNLDGDANASIDGAIDLVRTYLR